MSGGSLRARWNDFARAVVALALWRAGVGASLRHRFRLARFARGQRRLRTRYEVTTDTPITRELDEGTAEGDPVALTSGTAGEPKRVPYSARRLRIVRGVFVDAVLRLIAARRIRRTSLYVFSALEADQSLSSLLVRESRSRSGPPPRLALLQAPYRAHSDPAFAALAEQYGTVAVRVLVLTVANPGILYATNPSTLSTFFEALEAEWESAVAIAQVVSQQPEELDPAVLRVLARLRSVGDAERLARVAVSAGPLPITEWAPAVTAYLCWTGGAVAPFLERLDAWLPAPRFAREAMFSMSTETVETVPDYPDGEAAFLPAAPGVLYEFVEPDAEDAPSRLLAPHELEPQSTYEMVVSHGYGLRRYATGDLFRVERMVAGLPDLRFLRRRGLGWSFTGEKLTGEQVGAALDRLEAEHPGLRAAFWLALFPAASNELPCYRLVAVGRGRSGDDKLPEGLGERLDALLTESNLEYRAKRKSHRLGPIRLTHTDLAGFLRRASGSGTASADAQFKFQPFYPRLWK